MEITVYDSDGNEINAKCPEDMLFLPFTDGNLFYMQLLCESKQEFDFVDQCVHITMGRFYKDDYKRAFCDYIEQYKKARRKSVQS